MRKLLLIITFSSLVILAYTGVHLYRSIPQNLVIPTKAGIHLLIDSRIRGNDMFNKPLKILVLLGNDQEIRSNMGFPGSYATFSLNCQLSVLNCPLENLSFHDIYTPTGQIQGHVEPPKPIQDAFQQGEWLLPNFDFSSDFPTSAKAFRWFMEKAGEEKFDLLVTLNLSTVRKILNFVGLDSRQTIADLQAKTEVNFFPGSTQKKDALEVIGEDLAKKISSLSNTNKIKLAKIILDDLDSGNILLNSSDDSLQKLFSDSNWTGNFPINSPPSEGGDKEGVNDFFMMIENNYGANKANCCVSRKTVHTITQNPNSINHKINISFTNSSPLENPDPPRFYCGNYLNYIRIYIPESASNIHLTDHSNPVPTGTRYPILGFPKLSLVNSPLSINDVSLFHLTRAGQSSSIDLSYDLPLSIVPYQLSIYKQNGLPSSPQEINLFGKTYTTNLSQKIFEIK